MSSPIPLEDQGDLFPHETASTVQAYGQRLCRRLHQLASQLTADDCRRLLGEIALVEIQLDKIERASRWLGRRAPLCTTSHQTAPPAVYGDPWGPQVVPWRSGARWSRWSGGSVAR